MAKALQIGDCMYPMWLYKYISVLDLPPEWLESPRRIRQLGEKERREDQKICAWCKVPKTQEEYRPKSDGVIASWCRECMEANNKRKKKKVKI
jgi:hypothetical protein